MDGYADFADGHITNLKWIWQTFKNISAVLSKREMSRVGLAKVLRNRCRISCYKKQN